MDSDLKICERSNLYPLALGTGLAAFDLVEVGTGKKQVSYFCTKAEDLAVESLCNQLGHQMKVVQMGMGQENAVDALGNTGRKLPVLSPKVPLLRHSAIYQQPLASSMFRERVTVCPGPRKLSLIPMFAPWFVISVQVTIGEAC